MAVVKQNHHHLLKKLKLQVTKLLRKEADSRNKLLIAMKNMRALGEEYRSKVRLIKAKVNKVHGLKYSKSITVLERRMVRGIEGKSKALTIALDRLEKKIKLHAKPVKHTRKVSRKHK